MYYHQWRPYVPVAKRRFSAMRKIESLRQKGINIQPVKIEGRKIAKTFWGEAWCDHLALFGDYENRLPRGRTYVRNGSVCHLAIAKGKVEAKVIGSSLYSISIKIKTLPSNKWSLVKQRCSGKIGSLIELLQGKLSENVMEVVTDREKGLFPLPGEISFDCSCPDWAIMCKHVAAVLYGVGARLDHEPDLLFKLRGVDHEELIAEDTEAAVSAAVTKGKSKRLVTENLSDVFGVDIVGADDKDLSPKAPKKKVRKRTAKNRTLKKEKKSVTKKAAKKKTKKKSPVKKATSGTSKKTASKKPVLKAAKSKKIVRKPGKKKTPKKANHKTIEKKVSVKSTVKKKLAKKLDKKVSGKKTTAKKTSKVTGKKVPKTAPVAVKNILKSPRKKKVTKKSVRKTVKKQYTRNPS